MYNEIEKELERMMIDYPNRIDLINKLNEQKVNVYDCSWEDGEVEAYLKTDGDVLNDIEQDTEFYEDARNVQDMLINSQIIAFED